MGIRQTLNRNPLVSGIVSVAIVVAAGLVLYHFFGPQKNFTVNQVCYSDDDGQTFFLDDIHKIPPFDHNGKEAVRANVFTYANGSKKFIAYLQKFTPEYKKKFDDAIAEGQKKGTPIADLPIWGDRATYDNGFLVKAPGPGHPWVPMIVGSTEETSKVMNTQPPDGSPRGDIYIPD